MTDDGSVNRCAAYDDTFGECTKPQGHDGPHLGRLPGFGGSDPVALLPTPVAFDRDIVQRAVRCVAETQAETLKARVLALSDQELEFLHDEIVEELVRRDIDV